LIRIKARLAVPLSIFWKGQEGAMSALSPNTNAVTPFAAIARWWRAWRQARSDQAAFRFAGADETRAIAHDVGVSVSDLEDLTARRPESAELLLRRMSALKLDPSRVARSEPLVLRDLQRLCTMCQSKGRCVRDLATDPTSERWRDYCPNVTTLDALQAEQAAKTHS
jgi:hypothetical protein